MPSLLEFARRMDKLGSRVESNAIALAKNVSLDITKLVVINTPIDKGTAKSNFIISIGDSFEGKIAAHSPGKGGSTASANITITTEEAALALSSYKGGKPIHLTNNLPYIVRLNENYSDQAQSGYIQLQVLKVRKGIKSYKLTEGEIKW